MYRIGLKLWSTNTDHYLREAKRLYADKVFDYIELFVVPDTLGTLEAWTRLHQEDGIPFVIHNAHSAVGFNLADADCEKKNREIYLQTKQFADRLDAAHIIFHGGVDGTVEETARQLKNLEEPRALIENKPYLPLPGPQNRKACRGATYEELLYVLRDVGCGFCLDVGHAVCSANSQDIEPYSYIKHLASLNPVMFHLSDVVDLTSRYDSHPHLGVGNLDIRWLRRRVFASDATITIETVKNSREGLCDFAEDVRYLNHIEDVTDNDIVVRKAEPRDMTSVYELANDSVVRANSLNTNHIAWEEHVRWFNSALVDPDLIFLVVELRDGKFVGQVRFKKESSRWIVSISIASAFRGRGVGAKILLSALNVAKVKCARAYIKQKNRASLRLFERSGFHIVGSAANHHKALVCMDWSRGDI